VELHKIRQITWATLGIFIVGIISSGALFIFLFNKNLFLSIDLARLIILSLSITGPLWIINSMTIIFFDLLVDEGDEAGADDLQVLGILGSVMCFPVIYVPILVKFFFEVSLETGVIIALVIEFIIVVLAFVEHKIESRKKKSKS
jgi:hypothetical protein